MKILVRADDFNFKAINSYDIDDINQNDAFTLLKKKTTRDSYFRMNINKKIFEKIRIWVSLANLNLFKRARFIMHIHKRLQSKENEKHADYKLYIFGREGEGEGGIIWLNQY